MSNGDRPLIVVPSDDPAQCQGSPRMAELEAVADLKIFPTRADSFDLQIERARGPIVDEGALVEALNAGHLTGAALDVFEDEPLPEGSPITRCEHVVLTPHIADMTPEGLDLLNQGVVENSLAFLNGTPQNVVN